MFKPLGGEGSSSHAHAETPPAVLERVHGLHEAFAELKTDMMEEVKDIDRKLVVPAKLARDALKPMEKAIKKRDDAKVRHTLRAATSPVLTLVSRSTTNAIRAAAKASRTRRRAPSARTMPWPSTRSILNAPRTHTNSPTRICAIAYPV
jgi:hypothetical protein